MDHMDKFYHYNKNLRQYSEQLRNNSTLAEVILWNEILKGRKLGYQFYRQRLILNYVGDFFCKELKLVIETDGVTHLEEDVKRKDKEKQENLFSHGYTILRFKDEEVVGELERVRERIKLWIKDYENKYPEVIKNKERNRRR
jgi:very-short-patch-repair endonuclease